MQTRQDPLFGKIERFTLARRGPGPSAAPYWLHDDSCADYCGDCVSAIPALGGLVVCHLLLLIGVDVMVKREHDLDEYKTCRRCDWHVSWNKECLTLPEQIVHMADDQRDGGWRGESDGFRFCENCSEQLDVCLTGYGAKEELRHQEESGPPDSPDDWYSFSEMLNSIEDEHLPSLAALWKKWGLGTRKRQPVVASRA